MTGEIGGHDGGTVGDPGGAQGDGLSGGGGLVVELAEETERARAGRETEGSWREGKEVALRGNGGCGWSGACRGIGTIVDCSWVGSRRSSSARRICPDRYPSRMDRS